MNWSRLREKVLEEVYPDEEEVEEAKELYEKISDFIYEEFGLETHFAGSTGRGTCMKADKDIDIFVLFPEDAERQELEEKGLSIGKKVFQRFDGDYEVDYAEHPYTRGEVEGHDVEVVPCFDVKPENIRSAVDRSPHHSEWVRENIDQDLKKDAVILKSFLKSAGLYGSSLKVRGFSGYLCEILVLEYEGFRNLVEEASDWHEREVIDPEEHHEELPDELEEKFSSDSLMVIDPVDPERNVASVLSKENYAKFVYRCWQFKRNPGKSFFQEREEEWTEFELKQELDGRADFLAVKFDRPGAVDDILYPQMRKLMRLLRKKFSDTGFRIYESGFYPGEEKIRFFLGLDDRLPEVKELEGPKVFHNEKHIEQFTSKYDDTFIRGDRLYAKTEREFISAREFLKHFLEGEAPDLREKGVPNYIADEITEYAFFDMMDGEEEWLNYLAEELKL